MDFVISQVFALCLVAAGTLRGAYSQDPCVCPTKAAMMDAKPAMDMMEDENKICRADFAVKSTILRIGQPDSMVGMVGRHATEMTEYLVEINEVFKTSMVAPSILLPMKNVTIQAPVDSCGFSDLFRVGTTYFMTGKFMSNGLLGGGIPSIHKCQSVVEEYTDQGDQIDVEATCPPPIMGNNDVKQGGVNSNQTMGGGNSATVVHGSTFSFVLSLVLFPVAMAISM